MKHQNTDLTFYFIRHGECERNLEPHLIGGQSRESLLTEKGIKQAHQLSECLPRFDRVFASPIARAMATALLAAPGVEVDMIEALAELSQGEWEGKRRDEIYTTEQVKYINTKGYLFQPPGGESQRQTERRVSNWLEDEILDNEEYLNKPMKIAIFAHGNVLKCLMHYIMHFDDRFIYRIVLDNTSVSIFKFNSQGWWPIKINDTSHLSGGE